MKINNKNIIQQYNLARYEIVEKFCRKYFYTCVETWNNEWMLCCYEFDNYFVFRFDEIYTAIFFDIPEEILIEWYDSNRKYNLKNFYFKKRENEKAT